MLFVNQKTSKGKKEKKRKEMNKGTCTVNIYIHIYIYVCIYWEFETQNLRRGTTALVLVEDIEVTNKEEGKM